MTDGEALVAWLTGTGSRRLEDTNSGHKNAEGMPAVGVRVEPPVRLGSVVEARGVAALVGHFCAASASENSVLMRSINRALEPSMHLTNARLYADGVMRLGPMPAPAKYFFVA